MTAETIRVTPSQLDNVTAQPSSSPDTRRLNVNFTGEAYEQLQALAKRRGVTISEAVRQAIALEQWFDDVLYQGGKILVERPGSRKQEVIKLR